MNKAIMILIICFVGNNLYCQSIKKDYHVLKGSYFGQTPPDTIPEVFAPGIISNPDIKEFSITFSPKGDEIFFYRLFENYDAKIFYCKVTDSIWTYPVEFKETSAYPSFIPCFINDDSLLFFAWRKPQTERSNDYASMWFVERKNGGWSEPKLAGKGMYLTSTQNGHYYTGIVDSIYGKCLAEVRMTNGVFVNYEIQLISPYTEEKSHPCIAPDGSYIIFDKGGDHMSVSFKMEDGNWSKSIPLWENGFDPIAGVPSISPDGKYLFFKQGSNSNRDIYWVSTDIIKNLYPFAKEL